MLLSNRSYRCRVSYLPASERHPGSFIRQCNTECGLCARTPSSPFLDRMRLESEKSDDRRIGQASPVIDRGSASLVDGMGGPGTGNGLLYSAFQGPAEGDKIIREDEPTSRSAGDGIEGRGNEKKEMGNRVTDDVKSEIHIDKVDGEETRRRRKASVETFAKHSSRSLLKRSREWKTIEDDFAGIMIVCGKTCFDNDDEDDDICF